jgi:hypothetical protein
MRDTVAPGVTSRPLLIAGAAVLAALAGTLLVWAQYGTMVFFERAGLVTCFG